MGRKDRPRATAGAWIGGDLVDLRNSVAIALAITGLACMGVFG